MIRTYLLFQNHGIRRRERSSWTPYTDLYHCKNELVIRLEAAGMRLEDFSITVDDSANKITIAGTRRDNTPKEHYIQMEVPYGDFEVTLDLPTDFRMNPNRLSALYENGFFIVRCPKLKPHNYSFKKVVTISAG